MKAARDRSLLSESARARPRAPFLIPVAMFAALVAAMVSNAERREFTNGFMSDAREGVFWIANDGTRTPMRKTDLWRYRAEELKRFSALWMAVGLTALWVYESAVPPE